MKGFLEGIDLENPVIVMDVYTKNGTETRRLENHAQLINFRGVPEYVRNPVLRPGEEMFRTLDGDCIIIETEIKHRAFVTDLNYEWDTHQVKRTVVYSDGRTSTSHLPNMPTKEEFRLEKEMYSTIAGANSYG